MHLPLSPFRWIFLFAGLALLVIGSEVTIVHSAAFSQQPDWLSMGIAFDMLLLLPALYYFLIIRKLNLSLRSLIGIFGIALTITALILPTTYQQFIDIAQKSLLAVELFFVGYVLLRINKIIRNYWQLSTQNPDFVTNLLQSLDTILGHSRFNRILVSELSVLRYGLLGWCFSTEKTTTDKAFSSHQNSGQIPLTIGVIFIALIETLVVHLLLNRWSPATAWGATMLSFYGLLFFAADLVATTKRPVLVRENELVFRFGLRGYGVVAKSLIEQVLPISDKPAQAATTMNGAFLTAPNLLITVREPVVMTGLLGKQRSISQIALFIDDKQQFINELTA